MKCDTVLRRCCCPRAPGALARAICRHGFESRIRLSRVWLKVTLQMGRAFSPRGRCSRQSNRTSSRARRTRARPGAAPHCISSFSECRVCATLKWSAISSTTSVSPAASTSLHGQIDLARRRPVHSGRRQDRVLAERGTDLVPCRTTCRGLRCRGGLLRSALIAVRRLPSK